MIKPRYKVSEAGLELIMGFEGYRESSGQLADGRWTIGFGHTKTARAGVHISRSDAKLLLLYDLTEINLAMQDLIFTPLNQNQIDALSSFTFNIGVDGFQHSVVLQRINEGALLQAACAIDLWRRSEVQGEGIVVDALVRRRAAEKALFLTPPMGWSPAPTPVVRPALDQDLTGVVPTVRPLEVLAPLTGDLATAEVVREREAPAEPSLMQGAGDAVAERLQALIPEAGRTEPAAPTDPIAAPPAEAPEPEPHAEAPPAPLSDDIESPHATPLSPEPHAEPESPFSEPAGSVHDETETAETAPTEPHSAPEDASPLALAAGAAALGQELDPVADAYLASDDAPLEPAPEAHEIALNDNAPLEVAAVEGVDAHEPEAPIETLIADDAHALETVSETADAPISETAPSEQEPEGAVLDEAPSLFKPIPVAHDHMFDPVAAPPVKPPLFSPEGPMFHNGEPFSTAPEPQPEQPRGWSSEGFSRPTLFPDLHAPIAPRGGLRTPAAAKFSGFEIAPVEPGRGHIGPLLLLGLFGLLVFAAAAYWSFTVKVQSGALSPFVLGGFLFLVGIGCVVASVYFLVHWFLGDEV